MHLNQIQIKQIIVRKLDATDFALYVSRTETG